MAMLQVRYSMKLSAGETKSLQIISAETVRAFDSDIDESANPNDLS